MSFTIYSAPDRRQKTQKTNMSSANILNAPIGVFKLQLSLIEKKKAVKTTRFFGHWLGRIDLIKNEVFLYMIKDIQKFHSKQNSVMPKT